MGKEHLLLYCISAISGMSAQLPLYPTSAQKQWKRVKQKPKLLVMQFQIILPVSVETPMTSSNYLLTSVNKHCPCFPVGWWSGNSTFMFMCGILLCGKNSKTRVNKLQAVLKTFPHFYVFVWNGKGGKSRNWWFWECHVNSLSGKSADLAV